MNNAAKNFDKNTLATNLNILQIFANINGKDIRQYVFIIDYNSSI